MAFILGHILVPLMKIFCPGMWGCRKTHLVIFNFFSECRLFLTLFYLRNCDRIEVVFLHLLNDFVFDLKSVLHSTHVGWVWYPIYYDFGCLVPNNLSNCCCLVFRLPFFLIYPVPMSIFLLFDLFLFIVWTLRDIVCCEGKRRDHEIDTVQTAEAQYVEVVPVVNVDAEVYDCGEIGEVSEVITNTEAHYLGYVLEVIADPDHSLQSSFVRPAVVVNEAYNV